MFMIPVQALCNTILKMAFEEDYIINRTILVPNDVVVIRQDDTIKSKELWNIFNHIRTALPNRKLMILPLETNVEIWNNELSTKD